MRLMPDSAAGAILHPFHPCGFLPVQCAIGQRAVLRAVDMRLLVFQPRRFTRSDRTVFDSTVNPRFLPVLPVVDVAFHAFGRRGLRLCCGADTKNEEGGERKGFHGVLRMISGAGMHRLYRLNAMPRPALTPPACNQT